VSEPLLCIRGLRAWIGEDPAPVRAVDGIDLDIRGGETFALLGESGCGKSMTALSIMRLLPQGGRIVGGSVRLDGEELLALPEYAMRDVRGGRMAMIFQEPMTSLNPVLTVGRQIGEAVIRHDRLRGRAVIRRTIELLDSVGIPDPERRIQEYPHQLSGGIKQRVMIAIALAGRPEILIADEPTTALDVTIQAQVLGLLKGLQRDTGLAILLITHDLGVVAETADRVAVMYAGQIVESARCDRFFDAPCHPYSRKLFDSVPTPQKRGRALSVIEGTVPHLDETFVGCRFASRCDLTVERCRRESPGWTSTAGEDGVRCHMYDPGRIAVVADQGKGKVQAMVEAPAPGGSQVLLEASGLKVHFPIRRGVLQRTVGHVYAVDGVDLRIPSGRTLALVGESGCGKTTVGKGLLQLVRPTGGSVMFDGLDLTRLRGKALRSRRSDIQIIFQDPFSSMNPRMMVGDIIEEGMLAQGIGQDKIERRSRTERLLEHVGLSPAACSRYPHEFSGGQRQRICIARALAVEPKLIVCDEPTSALDVSVQAQILNLLKRLQRELGLAYLFISHDISVVSYLAHEVAVMYLGRIVEQGTVGDVLGHPRHPYTRALLSAVPDVDPSARRQLVRLEGDMPSPASPPAGCHFHPRCPEAVAACRAVYPRSVSISETHSVRCLRV